MHHKAEQYTAGTTRSTSYAPITQARCEVQPAPAPAAFTLSHTIYQNNHSVGAQDRLVHWPQHIANTHRMQSACSARSKSIQA